MYITEDKRAAALSAKKEVNEDGGGLYMSCICVFMYVFIY